MSRTRLITPILITITTIVFSNSVYAQVPERSISGQTLHVSDEELDSGMIYHIWPGGDTHLIIESEGYLQRAAITTNRMVGYVVVPFDLESSLDKPLLGGAFRVPVASLNSGIDGGDSILTSPDFFDAGNYPEIGFKFKDIVDVSLITQNTTTTEMDAQLVGTFYVKENVLDLTIPVNLKFLPSKFRLYSRNLGDVLILKGESSLNLEAHDWKPKAGMQDRVAEVLRIDIFLLLSTISPDKSVDPRDHPVYFAKQLKFKTLLRDLDDPDSAYSFGERLMMEIWNDEKELVKLANFATGQDIRRPNYLFALKALQRAVELDAQKNHSYLQKLASIYYRKGDLEAAIQWQKKAVDLLGNLEEDDKAMAAKSTLNRYEKEAQ